MKIFPTPSPQQQDLQTPLDSTETNRRNVSLHFQTGQTFEGETNIYAALESYRRALDIQYKISGGDAITASILIYMGDCHFQLEKYLYAFQCYSLSLTIVKNLGGENHPDVEKSMYRIGRKYWETANYEKALDFFQQAAKIRENRSEVSDSTAMHFQWCIANCEMHLGQYSQALDRFKRIQPNGTSENLQKLIQTCESKLSGVETSS